MLGWARIGERRGTARVGLRRYPFSVNCEIFTFSLLQVEMNLNIFRNANHHSHSKNCHGLETQQKVFRYIYIVLCLVSLSVRLWYIH